MFSNFKFLKYRVWVRSYIPIISPTTPPHFYSGLVARLLVLFTCIFFIRLASLVLFKKLLIYLHHILSVSAEKELIFCFFTIHIRNFNSLLAKQTSYCGCFIDQQYQCGHILIVICLQCRQNGESIQ